MDEAWVKYGYESCNEAMDRMAKMHHLSPEQETYNNLCTILVYLYEKDLGHKELTELRSEKPLRHFLH